MLLYVFFGGKNVPMEFMCRFSRKAWIRWDPPVLPDRVSPLGIGGAQSICEPPRTEGGRIELLSMLSSLFCGQARSECLGRNGRSWPVFQLGWFFFLNMFLIKLFREC